VDTKSGHKTLSILALPVSNNEGEVIGVAQVINKKKSAEGDNHFGESDIEVRKKTRRNCVVSLHTFWLLPVLLDSCHNTFRTKTLVSRGNLFFLEFVSSLSLSLVHSCLRLFDF